MRLTAERAPRRHVDDARVRPAAQVLDGAPGDVGRGKQVGADDRLPGLLPLLVRRVLDLVMHHHGGVVDQDVEAAERCGCLIDHVPHRVRFGQFGPDHGVPVAGQLTAERFGALRVGPVVQSNPVTLVGERGSDRTPDAAHGPRHEYCPTRHQASLLPVIMKDGCSWSCDHLS